jgi:hypothetical protein
MIGEEGKILERWIEYFTEMLHVEEQDKEDEENYKRKPIVKPDICYKSQRKYANNTHDKS